MLLWGRDVEKANFCQQQDVGDDKDTGDDGDDDDDDDDYDDDGDNNTSLLHFVCFVKCSVSFFL